MALRNFFKRVKKNEPEVSYAFIETALGEVAVASTVSGICRLQFRAAGSHDAIVEGLRADHPGHTLRKAPNAFTELREQLEAYLNRELQEFTLPLDPHGTPFRREVWEQARLIPYGTTITYGDLAGRMGKNRSASRAVGNALGANPLPILIPCHRVLGRDGRLTGYGGGLALKTRLLRIEGALLL
jgi:O-6-methylguanine DNA methyltransferase